MGGGIQLCYFGEKGRMKCRQDRIHIWPIFAVFLGALGASDIDPVVGKHSLAHNILSCNHSSLTPSSVLPPPHTHTFQHIIFCKYIGPRLCVRFFVKGARSMGLLHIHTTHFINTRKHPTPKRLDKVYKGVLVVPLFSPQQRLFVCGVCIDTAQVASRWCPFSTHCSNGLGCIVSIYV